MGFKVGAVDGAPLNALVGPVECLIEGLIALGAVLGWVEGVDVGAFDEIVFSTRVFNGIVKGVDVARFALGRAEEVEVKFLVDVRVLDDLIAVIGAVLSLVEG